MTHPQTLNGTVGLPCRWPDRGRRQSRGCPDPRARYGIDLTAQHDLLNRIAELIDDGRIRTTLTRTIRPIDAASLREAHAAVETGRTIGTIVVARE